jgi:hypothetical protein
MPTFHITVDDQTIAAVNTGAYHILSMYIFGTRDSEQLATLDISGGAYEKDAPPMSLTWVSEAPLLANQLVVISMDAHGATSHAGKTVAELFPDEAPCATIDFKLTEDMLEEVRQRPKFHEQFSFEFKSSDGTEIAVQTAPEDLHFSLSVLWNQYEDEARVALRTSTLADLEARRTGHFHALEKLSVGGQVSFRMKPVAAATPAQY